MQNWLLSSLVALILTEISGVFCMYIMPVMIPYSDYPAQMTDLVPRQQRSSPSQIRQPQDHIFDFTDIKRTNPSQIREPQILDYTDMMPRQQKRGTGTPSQSQTLDYADMMPRQQKRGTGTPSQSQTLDYTDIQDEDVEDYPVEPVYQFRSPVYRSDNYIPRATKRGEARMSKRSVGCMQRCLHVNALHPAQCHSLC